MMMVGGEKRINNIEGWMGESELDWLYSTARKMDSIVEVGSWKGRSTFELLSGCKGPVYVVDHFLGDPSSILQKGMIDNGENIYQTFLKNVGHFMNLKVLKMSSVEAATVIPGTVDMIFIDGGHSYQSVKTDIDTWLPKTAKLICGHDFNRNSVRRAIKEKIGIVKTSGIIWFKEICE